MADRKYLDVPIMFKFEEQPDQHVGWVHIQRLVAGLLEHPEAFRFEPTFQMVDGQLRLLEVSIVPASAPQAEGTQIARTFID